MVAVLDGVMRARFEHTGVHSTALRKHSGINFAASDNSDRDDLGHFQRT